MDSSQSYFSMNASETLLVKESETESQFISVINVKKYRLYNFFVIYYPTILGISLFISLNALLHTSKSTRRFGPDFISVTESINTGFLLAALVIMFKFILHRKEYISYSFTKIEKCGIQVAMIFIIIMYFTRIGFQLSSVIFSSIYYIDDYCLYELWEPDSYMCMNARYSIYIFSLSLTSDIIGVVISIIAVCAINKFTEKFNEQKNLTPYTIKMEKDRQSSLYYSSIPLIFSCITLYFTILLFIYVCVIRKNTTRVKGNDNLYLISFMIESVNLISILISNTCAVKFISRRNNILSNLNSNKEKKYFFISYILQFIFSLAIFSMTICAECFRIFIQALDYTILSFTCTVSAIYVIITAIGIFVLRKAL